MLAPAAVAGGRGLRLKASPIRTAKRFLTVIGHRVFLKKGRSLERAGAVSDMECNTKVRKSLRTHNSFLEEVL
jgi:hypothetical protein